MKNKRNFLFFFLMLVATMSALRYLSAGDQGTRKAVTLSKSVPAPREQVRERTFQPISMERRFCATETAPGAPLFGPLNASADNRGNLYVLDFGDLTLKQFSPEGRFLRSFGRGKGQGPGELMSVSDYRILPGGEVWIADFTGGEIEVFAPDGSLRRTRRMERQPYRVLPAAGGGVTLMLPLTSEHLFARFGPDSRLQAEYGKLVDDRLNGIALDGWISSTDDGSIVYVPSYFGWIASYSPSGKLKYLAQTVDRIPPPTIHRSGEGDIWVDPDARVNAKSAWLDRGNLYLLSSNDAGTRFSKVIDVYDAATGTYRHSLQAPEPSSGVVVRGGSLFTVKDTSVCAWTFRPAAQTARTAR